MKLIARTLFCWCQYAVESSNENLNNDEEDDDSIMIMKEVHEDQECNPGNPSGNNANSAKHFFSKNHEERSPAFSIS